MSHKNVSPREVFESLRDGSCELIDIREAGEAKRESIRGARNVPMSELDGMTKPRSGKRVVFHCKSGMRTNQFSDKLSAWIGDDIEVLTGGIDGWKSAGLDINLDQSQPIEIIRQVQMTAGGLVMLGVLGSLFIHPGWVGLSAFVGAGLFYSGASGSCAMAFILRQMPWNKSLRIA